LKEPVEELKREGITDAAMEATGVYRKSLYEMPEETDIKVTLINPGHCKNSGRSKTDENDSIRIRQYHSCGGSCVTRTSPWKHTANCAAAYTNAAW
jgi:transposase